MYRCKNCGWEGSEDERKSVRDYREEFVKENSLVFRKG